MYGLGIIKIEEYGREGFGTLFGRKILPADKDLAQLVSERDFNGSERSEVLEMIERYNPATKYLEFG
jgi:hypothetical protein